MALEIISQTSRKIEVMVTCPVCGIQNEGDFGLINCTSCGSPFFIQIDGSVEAAQPKTEAPLEDPIEDVSQSILEDFEDVNRQSDFNSAVTKPKPVETAPVEAQEDFMDFADVQPPVVSSTSPKISKDENASETLQDVADFGNSEESLAREGAYRFTLTVTGIDSAEIKTEVKDALTDGRFLWDIEALIGSMEDGILIINDLSAVKSALVVQRLKVLPVEIKWEQHAIHQSV